MQTWVRVKRWTTPRWWLERSLVVFLGAACVGYLGGRAGPAFDHWRRRTPERDLAREASRVGLTYADAVKRPDWARGKAVRWYLTHPAPGKYYYGGDSSLPVSWAGAEPALPAEGGDGPAAGAVVIAVVHAAGPSGVVLEASGG